MGTEGLLSAWSGQERQLLKARQTKAAGSGGGVLFSSSVRADEPISKPVIAFGHWKRMLANVAKWLGRRSNMIADDFEDRLTVWAKVQNIRHCGRLIICPNPPRLLASPQALSDF
jgi:hypothetical protein